MTERQRLPDRRESRIETIEFDGIVYDVNFGFHPDLDDGRIKEVFIAAQAKHKHGSTIQCLSSDAAVLISMLLQHGVEPAGIGHSLLAVGGPQSAATAPASIISCVIERIEEINREGRA